MLDRRGRGKYTFLIVVTSLYEQDLASMNLQTRAMGELLYIFGDPDRLGLNQIRYIPHTCVVCFAEFFSQRTIAEAET